MGEVDERGTKKKKTEKYYLKIRRIEELHILGSRGWF